MKRLALAACCLAAASARAGVVMDMSDKSAGDSAPMLSKAFVGTDRARFETQGNVMIWRADKQVIWVLNDQDKTYMEMTKEGMAGMSDAMKQAQAAMADLPPEQRAMVEQMMKQRMGSAAAQAPSAPSGPATWTSNGSSDSIGGRACSGYDGTRDGKVDETICATPYSTLNLTKDDFQSLISLGEFMREMAGPMAHHEIEGMPDEQMPGLPLRTTLKTPQGEHVHEITKIEKATPDAGLFEVPAGYTKQTMDGMAAAGHGPRGRH